MSKGAFNKRAIQILLENGADANAIDDDGNSCLSIVRTDVELVKILPSYGAQVSPMAIFSAIETYNNDLLESYLTQGNLANSRLPVTGPTEPREDWQESKTYVADSEIYPLYHAAFYSDDYKIEPDEKLGFSRIRMMETLLRHGADPYATFIKLHLVSDEDFEQEISLKSSCEDQWRRDRKSVV